MELVVGAVVDAGSEEDGGDREANVAEPGRGGA